MTSGKAWDLVLNNMKCTEYYFVFYWLSYSITYSFLIYNAGTSSRSSCMTHRVHHHWPVKRLKPKKKEKKKRTCRPPAACHARQIEFTSGLSVSLSSSACCVPPFLTLPPPPLPPLSPLSPPPKLLPSSLSLQSMRTLALQWLCRVPGHAAENNLLPPHLPHQHSCLHQHLPHGPRPLRGRRRHPGRHHRGQPGGVLPDGAGAGGWCPLGSEAHPAAAGLWAVGGAEAAALWLAQHLPG